MARFDRLFAVCLLVGQFLGCAQRWHGVVTSDRPGPMLHELLEPGDRGVLRLAVDSQQGQVASESFTYHVLEPFEAQCLAVERSSLGNLLDEQAKQLACRARKAHRCDLLLPHLLHSAAREARNQSAGKVLELYYTIARLEAQRELLDAALDELDDAIMQIDTARRSMITLPLRVESFAQQRLDVRRRRVELELGMTRANRELAKLLDTEWGDSAARIWPRTELRVIETSLSIDEALRVAESERPELDVVRTLACSDCVDQLPTMKALLGGYSVFLAASPLPGSSLLGRAVAERLNEPEELARRKRQFQQLAAQRQREVRDEVRLAVATIEARHEAAVIARDAVVHWDQRIAELEQARDVSKSDWGELVEANLKRIEAQSQLVEAVTAWQVARVQLEEAQGLLVRDCAPCHNSILCNP